jgi:hypothetical protein
MIDATPFMTEVLAMWAETDAVARRAAIERRFADTIVLRDAHGEYAGYAAIESFSDSLQTRFPGARFSLARPPQVVGNGARAYWYFGPAENPRAVSGMDFLVFDDDDKATAVYAFVESTP